MKTIIDKKKSRWNEVEIKPYDTIRFSNSDFDREFRNIQDNNKLQYFQISDSFPLEKDTAYFYKYLDLESALLSLKNGNIRFVEPTRWEDKFEGRFYNAKYHKVSKDPQDTPFLYACCMSVKPHNEAAWKVYSYGKVGIGAHCVQLKINRNKFRKELIKSNTLTANSSIFEGLVTYTSETIISGIHKKDYKTKKGVAKTNVNYNRFFSVFNRLNYLNLLLLKRDYFKHENEIRFFVIPEVAPQPKGKRFRVNGIDVYGLSLDIKIDWANVIEEIRIDSKCTELEYNIFKDECLKLLVSSPRYTSSSKSVKKVLEKKFTPIKTDVYGKRHSVTIE